MKERIGWIAAVVALAVVAALGWFGPARYQFQPMANVIGGVQVCDTRTGNVVTWIPRNGAWYRAELGAKFVKAAAAPPKP